MNFRKGGGQGSIIGCVYKLPHFYYLDQDPDLQKTTFKLLSIFQNELITSVAIGTLKIYFTSSKYFVIIFFPYITYNILYVFMMCFIIKILITIPIFIFSKIFTTRSRKLMLESRESLITLCCDGSFNQSRKKWASSHAH